MTLGQYVRRWRDEQRPRVSQEALAERMVSTGLTASVTGAWVSLLESDKLNVAAIGLDKLRALADVVNVTEADLLAITTAGLAGAQPPDELGALLARARALDLDPGLLQEIEDTAQEAAPDKRRKLVEGVRREVIRREAQRQQEGGNSHVNSDGVQASVSSGASYTALARVDARGLSVNDSGMGYSCGE